MNRPAMANTRTGAQKNRPRRALTSTPAICGDAMDVPSYLDAYDPETGQL